MTNKAYTAAIVVIGNEILSGRTQDRNVNYIITKLAEKGISFTEVRIIPDKEGVIVATVRELMKKVAYVFTTGGIGPTHDDITSASIAKALDIPLVKNTQAYEMLEIHYGAAGFNEARQKMAYMPRGAKLIPNSVSVAPGFISKNVYVMAGVPEVLQVMVNYLAGVLKGGDVVHSRTVSCPFPESVIAADLTQIQERFIKDVEIGSYPYFEDGIYGVNIVLRSTDERVLSHVAMEVELIVSSLDSAALTDSALEFFTYDTDKM